MSSVVKHQSITTEDTEEHGDKPTAEALGNAPEVTTGQYLPSLKGALRPGYHVFIMKKWKLDRIISIATLLSSVVAIVLVLKKPQPVSQPIPAPVAAAKVESVQQKLQQLDQPRQAGEAPAEVHLQSDEVSAALAQAAGALPVAALAGGVPTSVPSSADAPIAPGSPEVKDYQVSFEGDVARGQFVTNIGGKDVYVTLAGHLGSDNGYATFQPTEFKIGDLEIPVSMVNGALQKKLAEQRDRMKLPDDVGAIKVEKGELVMTGK